MPMIVVVERQRINESLPDSQQRRPVSRPAHCHTRVGQWTVPGGWRTAPQSPCQKVVPTEAALLILDPCLFAAIALEHADCPAGDGIEHIHDLAGLLAAGVAGSDRVRVKAGKDFVLKIAVHL